ncbi:MAG: Rap1a/Tai family immunity protein [Motiliproteus sp.]
MGFNTTRILLLTLLTTLPWGQSAQASGRWDILQWCSASNPEDAARCEGFLNAAIDMRTSDDFPGPKSCFTPSTRLPHVREQVLIWLKQNKVASEQSGLALVARAIKEQYPCHK